MLLYLKFSGKTTHLQVPKRAPIERLAVYRTFFYVSLGLLNIHGLDIANSRLYLAVQGKERPLRLHPLNAKGPLWRQLLCFHSQYNIH